MLCNKQINHHTLYNKKVKLWGMGLQVNIAVVVIFQKIKIKLKSIQKVIIHKVKVDYLKVELAITLG